MTTPGAGRPPGALDGLRVLDLSRVLAGPLAAQILADLGADVLKIERPGRGDDSREWAPPHMTPEPRAPLDASVYFWTCNRGKRSVEIDIATSAGRAAVTRLAAEADVLIENFKVGTLARCGLDYRTLAAVNPRLIYCSITGFGQTGPYRERPGYDTIVQALGGLMSITGNPDDEPGGGPRKCGVAVADQMTALYSAVAILAGVNERHRSGQGQHIDMSLLDVQVAALSNIGMNFLATGRTPRRFGNRLSTVYPSDNFRCRDGDIMLIVGNDEQFRRFCRALGMTAVAEDPRFARNSARLGHADELAPLISQALASRTVAECQRLLDEAGVPASRINDVAQALEDPQVVARGMVRTVRDASGREVRVLGSPIRLSRTPPADARVAPSLGQANAQIAQGWPAAE